MKLKIQEFPLPHPDSGPYSITAGLDGSLWFTENKGNRIGRVSDAGEIQEFEVLTSELVFQSSQLDLMGIYGLRNIKQIKLRNCLWKVR